MSVKFTLVSFVAFLLILQGLFAAAAELSCQQRQMEINKKKMDGIGICNKQLNLKGKEKSTKINCVLKCVLMREEVIDSNGRMSQEYLETFFKNKIPPNQLAKMRPQFENCQSIAGKNVDPAEERCLSYEPLVKCLMQMKLFSCADEEKG